MIFPSTLFLCIFIFGEILFSKGVRPDFTRKIVHILCGASIFALSFLYSSVILIKLGLLFSIVMLIDYKYRILQGINGVSTHTAGGPLFPLGATIALILSASKPIAFQVSILTITIADPLVWYIFSQTRFRTVKKTIGGSAIFGCISYLIWVSVGYVAGYHTPILMFYSVLCAFAIAVTDYFSVNGTDNLFILIISSFMATRIF